MTTVDPLVLLADRLDPRPDPLRSDPIRWVDETLGEHMHRVQREIMESVRDNRYTAVPSAHGTGKSFTASRIVAWWLDTHPRGEAFAVTTAPTAAQVGAVLWREIGRAHRKGGLLGYVTGANEWKLGHVDSSAELIAYGRKPADYDPSGFQGVHARYVLVVIDEAGGIVKPLYEAVDSLATNRHARVLAIGNPDDPASHFREICKPGSGWHVIHVDALRLPTMTEEAVSRLPRLREYMLEAGVPFATEKVPDELHDLLTGPDWVEERLRRWGKDSPVFQAKVRGLFPTVALNTVIDPHWVTLAQARERPDKGTPRLAVDVARYGEDKTVIAVMRNGRFRILETIARGPVTETAGKVLQHASGLPVAGLSSGWKARPVANVDDSGVGGGVTDILAEQGYPVLPLLAGSKAKVHGAGCPCGCVLPNGKPRFVNARSQWWWNAREALAGPSGTGDDSTIDLDEFDDELAAQLTNVRYRVNRFGQIEVESKDELRKRGLDSPDRADAFIMSLVDDPPYDPRLVQPDTSRMVTAGILQEAW